jgi:hypothetical protein
MDVPWVAMLPGKTSAIPKIDVIWNFEWQTRHGGSGRLTLVVVVVVVEEEEKEREDYKRDGGGALCIPVDKMGLPSHLLGL